MLGFFTFFFAPSPNYRDVMVITKDSDGDYKRLSGQPSFHQADFNDRDGEQLL